jgi:hypothetical protein
MDEAVVTKTFRGRRYGAAHLSWRQARRILTIGAINVRVPAPSAPFIRWDVCPSPAGDIIKQ